MTRLAFDLALFAIAAAAIWIAGTRLAGYADEISDRKRWGKALVGLVFLAGATELPEVVSTATAALTGNALLLINNLFGGVPVNTALLAIADISAAGAALTFYPRKATPILEGTLLILILVTTAGVLVVGDQALFFNVGIGVLLVSGLVVVAIVLLRQYDTVDIWLAVQIPEEPGDAPVNLWRAALGKLPMLTLVSRTAVACFVVLVCGVAVVILSDRIAEATGLGKSFIGVTLLAASTSLPEMSTTIMAIRLRSYTMAISNIFGSNLIMMFLLLPADFLYRDGPVLAEAGATALFALLAGIALTAIYVAGLTLRSHRTIFGMGRDSALVLAGYLVTLLALLGFR